GELLAGIVLGNVALLGFHGFDAWKTLPGLDLLAQIGVLFLLFNVGLESDVSRIVAVGRSALLAATIGVIVPLVLGGLAARYFLPGQSVPVHGFVGATLCATGVGITARVLSDLQATNTAEGRIILGAAVLDDVMGLIVLAVVSGLIQAAEQSQAFHWSVVVWIVTKAAAFLGLAWMLGRRLSSRVPQWAARLPGDGWLLPFALAFWFALAWLAGSVGLAPIVGAFAAGLILDVAPLEARAGGETRSLVELLEPLRSFLVPVFFVLVGMRVDLGALGHGATLGFAAVLTVAAVVGKQACALGVLEPGVDRLAVGLGMIPRGEVGLIFASIGATLSLGGARVIGETVFSAVVVMVVVTTFITPSLLHWRLRRSAVP